MAQAAGASDAALRGEVMELRALVKQLEARVDVLEERMPAPSQAPPPAPAAAVSAAAAMGAGANAPPAAASALGGLAGTTVNLGFDGYYGYNFNSPIGRANLLRAYDVSSNSFSINQANLVVDNAPDPANGKRFGARLDLQWGQATQTLQGNATNEPRPEIYREIFQAYGTYVAPIGNGVTIDFGKWSSSIGLEGNYTKDQINYSRSFWFDYLPFYHMGLRMNYKVNDFLSVNYWVTNGTQQTEAFNGYKDQLAGFVLTPSKNLSWTANYYLGQEHPDVTYYLNGNAPPGAPTQQGVPFEPIPAPPKGKLEHFRQLPRLAGDAKVGFRAGERLGDRALPDEFAAATDHGRRGLRASPAYAQSHSRGANRVSERPQWPVHRRAAIAEGSYADRGL